MCLSRERQEMRKMIKLWYVNRRQINSSLAVCLFLDPPHPTPAHRTETKYKKAAENKTWASFDAKLFTNNQSESEKISLVGESSGGRWGSGGSVWGTAGMGGVMSASGM